MRRVLILYGLRILSLASTFYNNETIVEEQFTSIMFIIDCMVVNFFLRHSVDRYAKNVKFVFGQNFVKKSAFQELCVLRGVRWDVFWAWHQFFIAFGLNVDDPGTFSRVKRVPTLSCNPDPQL